MDETKTVASSRKTKAVNAEDDFSDYLYNEDKTY